MEEPGNHILKRTHSLFVDNLNVYQDGKRRRSSGAGEKNEDHGPR